MTLTPMPGDIWAVRTDGFWSRLIRFGSSLRYLFHAGPPYADLNNHVVIVSHETAGVWFGVEGKPGGVGWADLTRYVNDIGTVTNQAQPKTDEQRAALLAVIPQVLGKSYDWTAIMSAVAADLHLPELWQDNWKGQGVPGHFICSSVAQWVYWHVGLAAPKRERLCTPEDWTAWILAEGWK